MASKDHDFTTTEVLDLLSKLIHREILKLAVLIGIAFAAFFVTRAIAASNRDMALRDASRWFLQGQRQLVSGKVDDAIDSFRRARLLNRGERTYAFAFARALAINGDIAGAQNALLALRQSSPEDPIVNLQLARLAAASGDVSEAVRYYQNALYAPWPVGQADQRRQVRVELIHFLLARHENARAIPELIALSADVPDAPGAYLETGGLFAEAGDHGRALEQFEKALSKNPRNGAAHLGAARAAFALGDYRRAAQHLRRSPQDTADVKEMREVIDWVTGGDPLASRIAASERARRLVDGFTYAEQRLSACLEQRAGAATGTEAQLQTEAAQFKPRLKISSLRADSTLDAGVDLIYRIERSVVRNCPPSTSRDRALILIGERHGAETP